MDRFIQVTHLRYAARWVAALFLLSLVNVSTGASLDQNRLLVHMEVVDALIKDLGADNALVMQKAELDDLGMEHAYFQQFYKGVRVYGGELITHANAKGDLQASSQSVFFGIRLSVVAKLTITEALAAANRVVVPKAAYLNSPDVKLVIFPRTELRKIGVGNDATSFERVPIDFRLAYLLSVQIEDPSQTLRAVIVVDAITGQVIDRWDDLHTSATVGSGNSEYSGTIQMNTNSVTGGYELRDLTRGATAGTFGVGNVVTNLDHGTTGNGTVYTDSDDTWGDGQNYVSSNPTTSANGQTAAVDAAYGIQVTWDMYKNVFARNGIDGSGTATYMRVHYGSGYDNAFWDDTCFCMTFGDGTAFKVLTALDVTGHELSHGVTKFNGHGGLNYTGESGGLNESSSDVMGTMAEFYAGGGGYSAHSNSIPSSGGNWTIGEQLESPPLRYMYKPSKDGTSPDAWSSSIGTLNVHNSSGPGNREFYFLSQGSSGLSTSDFYSSYLPHGMPGIGNDHAARIHYRALTTYYTATTDYAGARSAHLSAASDLYSSSSAEYRAVMNSFAAINVGAPAPGPSPALTSVIFEILLN